MKVNLLIIYKTSHLVTVTSWSFDNQLHTSFNCLSLDYCYKKPDIQQSYLHYWLEEVLSIKSNCLILTDDTFWAVLQETEDFISEGMGIGTLEPNLIGVLS
uniref:Uncharacterized protein n=1 Tax=Megaselia scalaris TaxID=36166 RepID=T1GJ35_MEGSC